MLPLITHKLIDAFLHYLDSWQTSVQQREGFTSAQKALMLVLSMENIEGL